MTLAAKKKLAFAECLLCSALWSMAGILMKLIPWSGFVIAGTRSGIAGLVAFAYLTATGQKLVLNRQSVFGALSLCSTMTLFSVANKMTTAANAIVFQFTAPIWILLISTLFLHKKFLKADVLAVALSFLGIALFFADSLGKGKLGGNLIALTAGLAFGCYYISLGGCPENQRMSAIILGHALTFLLGLPFIFLTSPEMGSVPVTMIVILGVFQLGIPYVLLGHASGYCSPLVCCLLGAVEPLLNPVWVAVFDGETPGALAVIGGLVVILTISCWSIYDFKHGTDKT